MHFYGYSHREVLELPLKLFWLMSSSVERIRSEQDLCNLRVASASQATKEGFKQTWDILSKQVGKVMVTDVEWKAENKGDEAGKAELRRLFGAKKKK